MKRGPTAIKCILCFAIALLFALNLIPTLPADTVTTLSDMKTNPELPEDRFNFVTPEGVDVLPYD